MSNSTHCAACKYFRRRCPEDCILAPYFPSNNPQRFSCVHKIFGTSNITRMLEILPVHQRATAANCMYYEAERRVEDPVYGCVKIIERLEKEKNEMQRELAKTRSQIVFQCALNAQQQKQQHQQMIEAQVQQREQSWLATQQQKNNAGGAHVEKGEPSWLSASQEQEELERTQVDQVGQFNWLSENQEQEQMNVTVFYQGEPSSLFSSNAQQDSLGWSNMKPG
ncbi:hypothetical protein Scep_013612 [Stephania cephalantha]|uniref:LOB domain-containing protein n=1 Tax=Stephania cephalantha TaxID=152367 RepID=A0AAP0JHI5_9MAGN